jgi:serine/threonine protein kinase
LAREPLRDHDPLRIGRYRLTARLGSGGMGVVYLGLDMDGDGSQVAVKVLRPELADDPEFRARFGREVASLMLVRGECTVRVIEADTASSQPFMVTEYAAGPSLSEYIDTSGPVGDDMLYGLAAGLAEALTAIHAAGVVHRDLKPSNVILGQSGPKVIDFGIAQTLDATSVTKTGMMVGSAGFMAPEQVTGRAGQAADIFTWAVTIAYAASGQPPFGTGESMAIVYRILHGSPDIAAVPPPLQPLVMAALAKDPERRPTAHELLDVLTDPTAREDRPAQAVLAYTWPSTQPRVGQSGLGAPVLGAPIVSEPDTGESYASEPRTGGPRASEARASRPGPARRPPSGSLLFEPDPNARSSARRRTLGRGRLSRRMTLIGVPAVALVAVGALVSGLLLGHVIDFGQLTANQLAPQGTTTAALRTYPGQQQRGVFQALNRVVASGSTIVAMGSQASDGLVRQQFFVSSDGGKSWRLARLHAADGGQSVPLGHQATLLAGGPGGWLAIGPQAIWTSPDGMSWTLASTHSVSPQLPGDSVWVITKTATGFLAAGKGSAAGGGTQAVIWTSRDGLTWQRMTAADLGLAGAGEAVQSISYATYRGHDTLIAGSVAAGGVTYSGAWLSTDGGSAWTRVSIPVSNGAGDTISGLAFDNAGLIAVRPSGGTSPSTAFGVAYFSPNGLAWQYAGTIDAAAGATGSLGWSPGVVKGTDYGFVVAGQTATGHIVAYISTGTGSVWQPTGSLGLVASESVPSVTVAPGGTVVAAGATHTSTVSQQPVFLEATATGSVRAVSVQDETIPELAVNSTAVSPDGTMVAVGSADGYPAVWQSPSGGAWHRVSSLSLVSAYPGLTALTSVTYGPSGWLAVGVPGPVVLTSVNGTTWQRAHGGIEKDLGQVSAVAVAAGPAGYSVVGRPAGPASASVADVWWSQNLTSWTKAEDMNVMSGSIQVLAVAAEPHGFVSAGSHNNQPAVWTTSDGRLWTTIDLALPAGASSAVLQQIAINGNHVVALGQEIKADSAVPFAEQSSDGGASWRQVPFSPPGPDTVITALTADSGGFTAAGQYGEPGQQTVMMWTSATGMTWTPGHVSGLDGGSQSVTALVSSGSAVTGIGSTATMQGQQFLLLALAHR